MLDAQQRMREHAALYAHCPATLTSVLALQVHPGDARKRMHEHAALDASDQRVLLPSAHALCAPHLRTPVSKNKRMRCCSFALVSSINHRKESSMFMQGVIKN